ncbi:MAG: VOC family protein [Anaerolineae bacterium]|nr:VOC family protein [Anaerolineae bacterium]
MPVINAFRSVVIAVSRPERAVAFYRDLLGFPVHAQESAGQGWRAVLDAGDGHTITLVAGPGPARASRWIADDVQTGLRHIGFKARDVDAATARLKAAGVRFTLDPLDATGGVRIAFFTDPDGALLEIVQGALTYHADGPAVADLPPAAPEGDALRFDHLAITVSDLARAQDYYTGQLGCPMIGQLFFHDERGFTITYLKAGTAVLELFSFSAPTQPNYYESTPDVVGLKYPVFEVAPPTPGETMLSAPDGVQLAVAPAARNVEA